jgi:acetate kinase
MAIIYYLTFIFIMSKNSSNSVLVINCGSSSLKFSLIEPHNGKSLLSGIAECLATNKASLTLKIKGVKKHYNLPSPYDHQVAINWLVNVLNSENLVDKIFAIGHRVVHGGELYAKPVLIDENVKKIIADLAKLAPLHNPANLTGITVAEAAFPQLPQVAIFDTAFHQSMPEKAYIYPIPYELYQHNSIRKYGFHGTSHYFVSREVAKHLAKPVDKISVITAHLGNGCSVTAIAHGKSVDSSMGFTPLEGVMMGTRSGSIDPGIIFYLVEQLNFSLDEVNTLLNKKSGLLGVSQLSNDCRTLENAACNENNRQAQLALAIFSYRVAKCIASLSASLTTLDALVFTGGIGENSSYIRSQVIAHLSLLNFTIDEEQNHQVRFGQSGNICNKNGRPCWVIPTNEEWVIAAQTAQLLKRES